MSIHLPKSMRTIRNVQQTFLNLKFPGPFNFLFPNAYHDAIIPYPDAKIAHDLTLPGGPCRYEIDNINSIMLNHILPAAKHLNVNISHILLSAAVYCYKNEEDTSDILPDNLKRRIRSYEEIHGAINVNRIKLVLQKDLTGDAETANLYILSDQQMIKSYLIINLLKVQH